MVVETRSMTRAKRANLTEEEYSNMFRSLNFTRRRNHSQRAARAEAVELVNTIYPENRSESDSDYDPENEAPIRPRIIAPPAIEPPPIRLPVIEPSINQSPTRRRFTMRRVARIFDFVFHFIGILIFAFVIYKYFFAEQPETFFVQRWRL